MEKGTTAHAHRSENSSWESVLSFQCVGTWDETQFLRLGGRCLYPLNYCIVLCCSWLKYDCGYHQGVKALAIHPDDHFPGSSAFCHYNKYKKQSFMRGKGLWCLKVSKVQSVTGKTGSNLQWGAHHGKTAQRSKTTHHIVCVMVDIVDWIGSRTTQKTPWAHPWGLWQTVLVSGQACEELSIWH